MAALRAVRGRALREDGAQRDRVRPDGGVRRGLQRARQGGIGRDDHPADAETAPLADAKYYRYDLDLASIAEVWRRGVVSSWLLDLTAEALVDDPKLEQYSGNVSDSGEGRDDPCRGRRGRAGAGAVGRALRSLQLARQGRRRRQDPVGDARGFGGHHERKTHDEHVDHEPAAPPTHWCCSAPRATSPSASCSLRCTTSNATASSTSR